jgi:hypothetical protein
MDEQHSDSYGGAGPPGSNGPQPYFYPPMQAAPPPPRRKSSLRPVWVTLAGVGIFVAGIGVGLLLAGDGRAGGTTPLEDAKEVCAPSTRGVAIGDDGTALIIDSAGAEEFPRSDLDEVYCIFDELEVPDSVISQVENTRALDGRQGAEWGDYAATWTYHPDDGLNLTIIIVR